MTHTECCEKCRLVHPISWQTGCGNADCACHSPEGKEDGTQCAKFYEIGYQEGRQAERERLKKVAQEYKAKGFELETFIYSGFIPDDITKLRSKGREPAE